MSPTIQAITEASTDDATGAAVPCVVAVVAVPHTDCADLYSADPAVVAAAEAAIGQIVGAAVRASGIGAP